MKSFKTGNPWREKAVERRKENKELGKRIKELKKSRQNWKGKYMEQRSAKENLEIELLSIKKKLLNIIRG